MIKRIRFFSLILALLIILSACDVFDQPIESITDENSINNTELETISPEECTAHKDADDNGKCDLCGYSLYIYIDFYAINDLHGKFKDTESNDGVDELTTYLKEMTKKDDHSVLISSGDIWQGSSESNLTRGLIMTEWMNHLGFASMTLGNHEYDWGEEQIERNGEIAEFPFLAINIFDRGTNKRVDYCEASTVIERGGIEIGIIGAIGDCYSSISADKTQDIYFKTGSELTALVKEEAERLRANGVDYIVYSLHDGYEDSKYSDYNASNSEIRNYYNSSLSDGYIDLVFEGHTHQRYVLIDEKGVYHMQGGGENKGISHVEIKYNTVTSSSGVSSADFVSKSTYVKYEDDPIVDTLLEKYKDKISLGDVFLGKNDFVRSSNEIKELVARLYYEVGAEKWANEYDIVLGGGFISTRSPYELKAGMIKYSDLQSILPFDNKIVLCSIDGYHLLKRFIETDNKNYFVYLGEYGKEIRNNIDPDKTYYIICDTYCSEYSANNLTVIAEYDPNIYARDLVADYIRNGGWKTGK